MINYICLEYLLIAVLDSLSAALAARYRAGGSESEENLSLFAHLAAMWEVVLNP